MIFVDGHVHIYDCFDIDLLFSSAKDNFDRAAEQLGFSKESATHVLLLTEGATDNWYGRLQASGGGKKRASCKVSANWGGIFSREMDWLMVHRRDNQKEKLYLVVGRQIVTAEGIEALALFCGDTIQNGLSLQDTIAAIRQSRGIPVLPWGVGKWLGKRGRRIKELLLSHGDGLLFLGDNGGRPKIWSTPTLFTLGLENNIALLPGTDPLPLPEEALRVGSFGFYLQIDGQQHEDPIVYLRHALCSGEAEIFPFGELLKNRVFLINQLRLRFRSLPFVIS